MDGTEIKLSLCLEDIANIGYDTGKIDEKKFDEIFSRLKKAIENEFSYSLFDILKDMNIPVNPDAFFSGKFGGIV